MCALWAEAEARWRILTSNVFFYGLVHGRGCPRGERRGGGAGAARPFCATGLCSVGERATIVPAGGAAVFGIVMTMSLRDLDRLYGQPGLQMYRAAAVLVEGDAGESPPVAALAYVLPEEPAPGDRNPDYAAKLRPWRSVLDFPPIT
jgi:hypothetical protein